METVRNDEDIKQAIRNGFLIGVATMVLGVIAFVLL
jgi:hypothetical protein